MLNPNIIGAIQNIQITQVIDLPATLEEKQEVITEENPIQIVDVSGLVLELQDKATITQVQDLQTEINTKLAEVNSIFREGYSYFCVDGLNDLHSVLPLVNTQGSIISVSSGSFGNLTPLTIDKDNLAIFGVPSTPPICEFACPLTIPSTANRIRTRYMSFDGVCNLNGKRCVYTHSTFNDNVNIGSGTTEYMTFANCEFSAGKTITFSSTMASVVYVIECNIAGATLVFNNASPLQVIFSNCSGFLSFPTSSQATLVGLNVLATGVSQHNISKIVLPTGEGTNNQVLTSTGSGNCIWTTPSGGGSGSGSGINLETIMVTPTGQSIVTKSGQSLTFQNVNAVIDVNTTQNTEMGGRLTYIPPTGTKLVRLSYTIKVAWNGDGGSQSLSMFCKTGNFPPSFSSSIITHSKIIQRSSNGLGETATTTIECIINIDPSLPNDIVNGTLQTWTTAKNFFFMCGRQVENTACKIHSNNGFLSDYSFPFSPPIIKIEAFS